MGAASALKSIDRIIGRPFCRLIPRPVFGKIDKIMRVLVVRPGGIGDAVLLAPVINSLKNTYPHTHITLLAEQRNAGVFVLVHGVDEVLCYDIPREFFKALRGQYDAVIDTEQWYRMSAVVARFVRAPLKIGFDTNERRRMFTHVVQYDPDAYEPDNFLALLKPIGIVCQPDTIALSLPPQSASKAGQLLHAISPDAFVVIFPGGSIPEKRWDVDHFSQVSKRLVENGYKIVVVGSREDKEDGDLIAGVQGLNLAGMTTLAETAAVIARSSLVISGDSGVLHLAAGLDIPTVSLFGPGNAAKWAPRGEKHTVLNRSLACSPCSRFGTIPPCPNGVRCMVEITPDEVVAAALFQLNKRVASLQTSEKVPQSF